jgi:DNA-binding CsgD family transcriptional regulator
LSDLPVVLAGAGLPQLPGIAGDAKSYAERLFDFPEIGSLKHQDAAAALLIPAQEAGVEIEETALAKLVEAAHGYPYFLQEWGYHVWNRAEASPITMRDVDAARDAVIRQLDKNFFLVRYDRLTPKEKEYLRAMAHLGPGPHRSGDIANCLGVKVETVAPRRSAVIVKGMIYSPAHGDTAFTVPLFDEYLKRVMPDWRPKKKTGTVDPAANEA